MQMAMKIGELSRQTKCPVETIRFYEAENLLSAPARSQGNYRLYNDAHMERLLFIRHCRSLDMTLDEIRILLAFRDTPEKNCAGVNDLLERHIGHVADRIRQLTQLQTQLKSLQSLCVKTESASACGILQGLSHNSNDEPTNLGSHSGGCH